MSVWLITLLALTATDNGAFMLGWNVPCAPAPDVTELVGAAKGRVEVELAPSGSSWALVVRYLDPAMGQRAVRTETCEEGAQAASLLIRLAMRNQSASVRQPRVSTQPPDPTAFLPAEAPRRPPPRFSLAISALAQQGTLPAVVPRLGLTAGLQWSEHWMGLLSLRLGLSTVVDGGPTSDARVVVQPLLGALLSTCWQPRAGRLSGGPCAVFGGEVWDTTGENVAHPRTNTAVSVVAGLDARGALQLWDGLSVTGAVGARAALLHPRVFFRDSGTVFESSVISFEGELGLRWVW